MVGFSRLVEMKVPEPMNQLPETNASTSVLKKNGFVFADETIDPEDGLLWRWTKTVEPVE